MSWASTALNGKLRDLQALAPGESVPSPCIAICRMDPHSGLCEGCLRTIEEIVAWGSMPDAGKRQVWQQLAQRLQERT